MAIKTAPRTHIAQLIIRRSIKVKVPFSYEDANDMRFSMGYWETVCGNAKGRCTLESLMTEGWIVKSISQSFVPHERDMYAFGYETAILEKEEQYED